MRVVCPQCGNKKTFLDPQTTDEPCYACSSENRNDQLRQASLVNKGHTHHCAIRQIWGDGECECGIN